MKTIQQFGLAVAALAILAPAMAQADTAIQQGWYIGLGGIGNFQTDAESSVAGSTDTIKYKTGWGVTGSGGYAWGNGIRTEGELAYRRAKVDNITGAGAGASNGGHLTNLNMMGNVLYDFATGTQFTPYIGGGIGAGIVSASDINTVVGRNLDSTRPEFAYQAIVGVSAVLDDNWAATLDYRYIGTTNADFKTDANDRADTQNASHNVVVGLRYTFDEPKAAAPLPHPAMAAAAPVPTPAPAAKAAVPQVPQSFMVFFDFDRSSLTTEAKRIIASAAQEYGRGHYVRIMVTGNTDTVGSAKYNQALSVRRAMAVQAEMNKLGIPANVVQAVGAGKTNLLVPTADGVREAQNRRAEIVLSK